MTPAFDLLATIEGHAAKCPSAVAVQRIRPGLPDESLTWAELRDTTHAFAAAFDAALDPGGTLPAFLGKSPTTVAALAGCIASGRCFAGINPKFKLPQLLHILGACDSRVALVDSAGLQVVRTGLDGANPVTSTEWWLTDQAAVSPLARAAAGAIAERTTLKTSESFLRSPTRELPDRSSLQPERPAVCLFTSGSTGSPKGVLIANSDLYARASAEIDLFELTKDDVLLSLLPFSFDVGLNQLLTSLLTGCRLVILDSWMPKDIVAAVERLGVTGVSGVPSIWLDLLKSGGSFKDVLRHRPPRYLTVSGGDMPSEALLELQKTVPGSGIFKTYGQTETFRTSALKPGELAARPRSVGRRFGACNIYIIRDDGGVASPGEVGQVVHTGPGVMLGYLGAVGTDGKRKANPFRSESDASEFAIFTGDNGYLDDEGYLHLAGRSDDMIKVNGNRVYLGEVASLLVQTPGVLHAEIVCADSPASDPSLVAFVVPTADSSALSARELSTAFSARAPSYMWPKLFVPMERLPLTGSGKPDRVALKAEAVRLLSSGSPRA